MRDAETVSWCVHNSRSLSHRSRMLSASLNDGDDASTR
jgi:hypothetical protein